MSSTSQQQQYQYLMPSHQRRQQRRRSSLPAQGSLSLDAATALLAPNVRHYQNVSSSSNLLVLGNTNDGNAASTSQQQQAASKQHSPQQETSQISSGMTALLQAATSQLGDLADIASIQAPVRTSSDSGIGCISNGDHGLYAVAAPFLPPPRTLQRRRYSTSYVSDSCRSLLVDSDAVADGTDQICDTDAVATSTAVNPNRLKCKQFTRQPSLQQSFPEILMTLCQQQHATTNVVTPPLQPQKVTTRRTTTKKAAANKRRIAVTKQQSSSMTAALNNNNAQTPSTSVRPSSTAITFLPNGRYIGIWKQRFTSFTLPRYFPTLQTFESFLTLAHQWGFTVLQQRQQQSQLFDKQQTKETESQQSSSSMTEIKATNPVTATSTTLGVATVMVTRTRRQQQQVKHQEQQQKTTKIESHQDTITTAALSDACNDTIDDMIVIVLKHPLFFQSKPHNASFIRLGKTPHEANIDALPQNIVKNLTSPKDDTTITTTTPSITSTFTQIPSTTGAATTTTIATASSDPTSDIATKETANSLSSMPTTLSTATEAMDLSFTNDSAVKDRIKPGVDIVSKDSSNSKSASTSGDVARSNNIVSNTIKRQLSPGSLAETESCLLLSRPRTVTAVLADDATSNIYNDTNNPSANNIPVPSGSSSLTITKNDGSDNIPSHRSVRQRAVHLTQTQVLHVEPCTMTEGNSNEESKTNDKPKGASKEHVQQQQQQQRKQQQQQMYASPPRNTQASSLSERAVSVATEVIVTDAIETLLFDEMHSRKTYKKHSTELSKSSLPGVVPISQQMFDDTCMMDTDNVISTATTSTSTNSKTDLPSKKSTTSTSNCTVVSATTSGSRSRSSSASAMTSHQTSPRTTSPDHTVTMITDVTSATEQQPPMNSNTILKTNVDVGTAPVVSSRRIGTSESITTSSESVIGSISSSVDAAGRTDKDIVM